MISMVLDGMMLMRFLIYWSINSYDNGVSTYVEDYAVKTRYYIPDFNLTR